MGPYVGRFAPSPTGPLHPGSLVAALGSWLDARAAGGRWLLRIEDVDTPRCRPGAAETIQHQLAACGLEPDAVMPPQSQRGEAYAAALQRLIVQGRAYPCACSRADVARALEQRGIRPAPGEELPYPGTCRSGLHGAAARAWRLRLPDPEQDCRVAWHDRRLGDRVEAVDRQVGDFVLRRADGLWAYQLAVVVDDAAQGVTDVVRGEDLVASTARQILLQRALGLVTPRYLHLPLLRDAAGAKLSKSAGDAAFTPGAAALRAAAGHLGLTVDAGGVAAVLDQALAQWPPPGIEPAR